MNTGMKITPLETTASLHEFYPTISHINMAAARISEEGTILGS